MATDKTGRQQMLTWAQKALTGMRLSESHSGHCLYRVSTLASVLCAANSNDFGFDPEIILQLLNAGASITERAVPAHDGDETCRVSRLHHGAQMMAATFANPVHHRGLVHQRRLQSVAVGKDHHAVKLGFASSHSRARDAAAA